MKNFEPKHLFLDFDGIMGSTSLFYTKEGKTMKSVSVNDSLLLGILKDDFKHIVKSITVISGDKNEGIEVTKVRLKDIGIDLIEKKNKFKYKYLKETFGLDNIIYFGDDIYDIPILSECFYSCVPKNTLAPIKRNSKYVSEHNGGDNFVSDAIIHLIKKFGKEDIEDYVRNTIS